MQRAKPQHTVLPVSCPPVSVRVSFQAATVPCGSIARGAAIVTSPLTVGDRPVRSPRGGSRLRSAIAHRCRHLALHTGTAHQAMGGRSATVTSCNLDIDKSLLVVPSVGQSASQAMLSQCNPQSMQSSVNETSQRFTVPSPAASPNAPQATVVLEHGAELPHLRAPSTCVPEAATGILQEWQARQSVDGRPCHTHARQYHLPSPISSLPSAQPLPRRLTQFYLGHTQ